MRIRSIKPEFYRSEDVDAMDWHTRLIFIGVWSYVDDNGVGIDKLSSIAADLFSHDLYVDPNETLRRLSTGLNVLQEGGQITRYSVDGKRYLHVTNWESHQRVANPNKARYPLPTCDNVDPNETLISSSVESNETLSTGAVEQRNRGTEEQGLKIRSAKPPSYPADFGEFWSIYPKKSGKDAALKAWRSATKRAPVSEIILGAKRYANDSNRDPTYTKNPATWLNGGHWSDEPERPRRTGYQQSTSEQRAAQAMTLADEYRRQENALEIER